jgi:hypothetical protein
MAIRTGRGGASGICLLVDRERRDAFAKVYKKVQRALELARLRDVEQVRTPLPLPGKPDVYRCHRLE